MKRCFLIIVALTLISTLAVAQAVVTSSGQATTQGAAVAPAPVSPPLVTTPIIHLGNAPTTTGATTATPGNVAGAANSTLDMAQPPSPVPIRPEINLGQSNVYTGPNNVAPANVEQANDLNAAAPAPRRVINLGVSSASALPADDGTHGRSLGEIARENRQRMQNANARSFTNADVARVGGAGGVSGVAANPGNTTYPADNGVINTGGIAVSANGNQGGVATPTNVPPTTEQATQPATPVTSGATTEKPSAATTPREMAQAQTPANPADQNAAPSDQNKEQRTLPKSGSFLPLIAIVGLGATAAGLLVRK